MSTSPENQDQTAAPERHTAPVMEGPQSHDEPDAEAQAGEGAPGETEEGRKSAAALSVREIFSAETFGITGLLTIAAAFLGIRLTELLPSLVGQSQEGVFAGMIVSDGAVALLAVAFAVVSLALAGGSTRPWVRWVASATIVLGVLFVAGSVAAYMLVPEPQPQPPMMPPGN